jgi:PAS domain S-box-containing protein
VSGEDPVALLARSSDLVCELSPDGVLLRVNAAFEGTLGYAASDLIGRSLAHITHPDDAERVSDALAGGAGRFEGRALCADASVRWVEWTLCALPDRDVVLGIGRDTTGRRRALRALASEQAALRRVATLVAHETPPGAVFAAVAREVGEVLEVDAAHLGRFDGETTVVSVAQWGRYPAVAVGSRFPLTGDSVSARVLRAGRTARMDGYGGAPGVIAATVRGLGIRFSIGVPIIVEGRTWGVMIVTSRRPKPFPPETETRLQKFTELVATAIANASAHDRAKVLTDEQRALRRVATLVAREAPQGEVFGAIAEEIGRLLAVASVAMIRYEDDRFGVVVACSGPVADHAPIGTRVPLEGRNVASIVRHTGASVHLDDYAGQATGPFAERLRTADVRSAAGSPITVGRRVWGVIMAITHDAPLPARSEARIGEFTELMAAAIANAEARAEVTRLADEQAALRRVATLVAQGPSAAAVFEAVTEEVGTVMDASAVTLARYDDQSLVVVATRGASYVAVGEHFPLGGTNVTSSVLRTGRTARLDDYHAATGRIGAVARGAGVRSTVAAPVIVDGRMWGVLVALWADGGPPPDDTEQRMARFAELLDTAIANADHRDQLIASRARVLAAGDDARRRVVRDLHDGAQQRLVQTVMQLRLAQRTLAEDPRSAESRVGEALSTAEQAMAELRELARGILPSALTHGGLRAGIAAFVARLEVQVAVKVTRVRLPADIEASAYFIVAESLTNVVKHASATRAWVHAQVGDGVLELEVGDDGVGGADAEGHGLLGIADRVDALGGRLRVRPLQGGGTVIGVQLPLPAPGGGEGAGTGSGPRATTPT